jgi:hypothetical protein
MIAMLRYGSGFPWNRLECLQENLGIPLPAATQCEIVKETAIQIQPAMNELIRQAAQGDVVHNDDTSMRVLSLNCRWRSGSNHSWEPLGEPRTDRLSLFGDDRRTVLAVKGSLRRAKQRRALDRL